MAKLSGNVTGLASEETDTAPPPQHLNARASGGDVGDDEASVDLRDSQTIPFRAEWSFGTDVITKVYNLTCHKDQRRIFCGVSHAGIVYDYQRHDMRFLLGHSNFISCISSDASGRWLVTAGSADDNTVIVWDGEGCFPVNTIFEPHTEGGMRQACISHDAKYLVTVGAELRPHIKFWQWTLGHATEDDVYVAHEIQGSVQDTCFNPHNSTQFMVTFSEAVLFCSWQDEKLQATEPNMHDKCARHYGNFITSTYMDRAHECLTATDDGYVIIWGNTFVTQPFDPMATSNGDKMFIKAVKLQTDEITSISSVDGVIATGDVLGNIKFYDRRLQLLYWCQNFDLPSIRAISFNLEKRHYTLDDTWPTNTDESSEQVQHSEHGDEDRSAEFERLYASIVPSDFSLHRAPFVVRDFVILGNDGLLGYVDFIENTVETLLPNTRIAITAIDIHGDKPLLCIGYADGTLSTYNYETRRLTVERAIISGGEEEEEEQHNAITSICYANQGLYLACGTSGGYLWFLQPAILEPQPDEPFFFARAEILSIRFSSDNIYLVYYDSCAGVALLKRDLCSTAAPHASWFFHGRYIAHTQIITDMLFTHEDSRLFTLGRDRHIVEYDAMNSFPRKLELISRECIMQTGVPLSFFFYTVKLDESYFVIATSEYKYILVCSDTYVTDRTVLAPILGVPVQKFRIIPDTCENYVLFATDKYLGVQRMPLTGNPCEHIAMIGHPDRIRNFRQSPDGKHAFTIAVDDNICFMWKLNTHAVDVLALRAGKDMKPYICLIDGGLNGWLMREMQDLFYYMQLLHQGENSALARKVSNKIPTSELHNFMRAVGFYPTEYALQNMLHEVTRYYAVPSAEEEEEKIEDEITFDNVLRVYINHRPARGVALDQLRGAFERCADNDTMKGENFVEMLCNTGEAFTAPSLTHCLKVLMHQARGGSVKEDVRRPVDLLPEELDFNTFASEILGLNMQED